MAAMVSLLSTACANDYPTEARVRYEFERIARHGGASHVRMYQCVRTASIGFPKSCLAVVCEGDRATGGERGGILREGRRAREWRERLEQVIAGAQKAWFLKPAE